jgi:Putative phage holin Dp-1
MADGRYEATNSGPVQLNNSQYDTLRGFVELVLPGLGTLYAGLSLLWGWGFIAEVTGSVTLLATFGGLLLKFARKGYALPTEAPPGGFDGEVVLGDPAKGEPVLQFKLDPTKVDDLFNKKVVAFKGFDPNA